MAIQDAGSISEEVLKEKAPYLIPAEGNWASREPSDPISPTER
jgi:hypothetical protein